MFSSVVLSMKLCEQSWFISKNKFAILSTPFLGGKRYVIVGDPDVNEKYILHENTAFGMELFMITPAISDYSNLQALSVGAAVNLLKQSPYFKQRLLTLRRLRM